ncbi:hypothetical protein V500_04411 [Pseudogymnoascus sp. VKM F-4518 (FW-2643)]|nr:hypothetical protein V500_04411 [Pseudogymnoascus sp. VKM F-4518 (FW-2643)]
MEKSPPSQQNKRPKTSGPDHERPVEQSHPSQQYNHAPSLEPQTGAVAPSFIEPPPPQGALALALNLSRSFSLALSNDIESIKLVLRVKTREFVREMEDRSEHSWRQAISTFKDEFRSAEAKGKGKLEGVSVLVEPMMRKSDPEPEALEEDDFVLYKLPPSTGLCSLQLPATFVGLQRRTPHIIPGLVKIEEEVFEPRILVILHIVDQTTQLGHSG